MKYLLTNEWEAVMLKELFQKHQEPLKVIPVHHPGFSKILDNYIIPAIAGAMSFGFLILIMALLSVNK